MRYVLFLLLGWVLLGCHPKGTWDEERLRGRIKEGRYYDQTGMFSIDLPPFQPPCVIQEERPVVGRSAVMFKNARGEEVRVEVFKGLFNRKVEDVDGRKAQKAFEALIFQPLCDTFPYVKKLEGEVVLKEGETPFYFALVTLPKGAHRGYAVFLMKDYLVALSFQSIEGAADLALYFKEKVTELKSSFQLTN